MSRYIDADALIADMQERYCKSCKEKGEDYNGVGCRACMVDDAIDDVDGFADNSIDIEPKRGEWIPCTKSGLPLTELMRREGQKWYGYRCSNCNHIYKGNALTDCNFCPNCGARMKGADDE